MSEAKPLLEQWIDQTYDPIFNPGGQPIGTGSPQEIAQQAGQEWRTEPATAAQLAEIEGLVDAISGAPWPYGGTSGQELRDKFLENVRKDLPDLNGEEAASLVNILEKDPPELYEGMLSWNRFETYGLGWPAASIIMGVGGGAGFGIGQQAVARSGAAREALRAGLRAGEKLPFAARIRPGRFQVTPTGELERSGRLRTARIQPGRIQTPQRGIRALPSRIGQAIGGRAPGIPGQFAFERPGAPGSSKFVRPAGAGGAIQSAALRASRAAMLTPGLAGAGIAYGLVPAGIVAAGLTTRQILGEWAANQLYGPEAQRGRNAWERFLQPLPMPGGPSEGRFGFGGFGP